MLSVLVVLRVLSEGGSWGTRFSQLTSKECHILSIGLFELSKSLSVRRRRKHAWNWTERQAHPYGPNKMAKGHENSSRTWKLASIWYSNNTTMDTAATDLQMKLLLLAAPLLRLTLWQLRTCSLCTLLPLHKLKLMVNELWSCHLPPSVKKQGNLVCWEEITTQTNREGAKLGDHETSEREKTEKMTSSSPQFSNFWFKAFRRLDHTLSLASLKGPWSLVINSFLLILWVPDQAHSNYLLSKKEKTKPSAWMTTFLADRLSIVGEKKKNQKSAREFEVASWLIWGTPPFGMLAEFSELWF